MEIHTAVNLGPRVRTEVNGFSRTKQADAKSTDINWIMKQYVKTGLVDHFATHGASYGFASSVSFHECMNVVVKAEQMFGDLPGPVRARFSGKPGEFLDFVQDPENQEEMITLGLAQRGEGAPTVPVVPVPVAESAPITPEVPVVAGGPPAG